MTKSSTESKPTKKANTKAKTSTLSLLSNLASAAKAYLLASEREKEEMRKQLAMHATALYGAVEEHLNTSGGYRANFLSTLTNMVSSSASTYFNQGVAVTKYTEKVNFLELEKAAQNEKQEKLQENQNNTSSSSTSEPDHYATLGVNRNASTQEIRASYFSKLAAGYDKNIDPSASTQEKLDQIAQTTQELSASGVMQAFQTLSKPPSRASYNARNPDAGTENSASTNTTGGPGGAQVPNVESTTPAPSMN